jgi:hypothetical protein
VATLVDPFTMVKSTKSVSEMSMRPPLQLRRDHIGVAPSLEVSTAAGPVRQRYFEVGALRGRRQLSGFAGGVRRRSTARVDHNNQSSPIPSSIPPLSLRRCARVQLHLPGAQNVDPLEQRLGQQLTTGWVGIIPKGRQLAERCVMNSAYSSDANGPAAESSMR